MYGLLGLLVWTKARSQLYLVQPGAAIPTSQDMYRVKTNRGKEAQKAELVFFFFLFLFLEGYK